MDSSLFDGDHARVGLAAIRTGNLVWTHVRAEDTNDPDKIMTTVSYDHLPLTFSVPEVSPDRPSRFVLPVTTGRDDTTEYYRNRQYVQGYHHLNWEPFVELRSDWYLFFQGVVTFRIGDGPTVQGNSIVYFPTLATDGISGELAFSPPPFIPGFVSKRAVTEQADPDGPALPVGRTANLALHRRYMEALASNDVESVMKFFSVDPQAAVRDYAADGPQFVSLVGADALKSAYDRFYAKYRVTDVATINLIADDWYIFSELRLTFTSRADGSARTARVAEMLPLDEQGQIAARIGYGTDPATLDT